jgi:hypothetical protein
MYTFTLSIFSVGTNPKKKKTGNLHPLLPDAGKR